MLGCSGDSEPELISSDISIAIEEDTEGAGRVSATGGTGAPVRYGVRHGPKNGTVVLDPDSGDFVYRPALDYYGSDEFTFEARDGRSRPGAAKVRISIAPVNDAPRIEPVPDLENSPTERITRWKLNVYDPEGDNVTVEAVSDSSPAATVRYSVPTGELEFESFELGETAVTVKADDGSLESETSFVFRVRRVVRAETLTIADPANTVLVVTNELDSTQDVGISWAGRTIFESREEMVDAALEGVGAQPIDRAIALWRFVQQNTYHSQSLAGERWEHDPLVLLNSIGFGLCDDGASALAHLARTADFEARVWSLNGHVVPEVRVGDRWAVFDTDLAVYYRNENGEIAGVEELQRRPDLISNPTSPIHEPASDFYGYQHFIADLYASSEDNLVWEWYDEGAPPVSGTFSLPPGAQLKFPGAWSEVVVDQTDERPPVYAALKFILPVGFSGTVRLPLVTREIRGSGIVRVQGAEYPIGDPALNELMARRWLFVPSIEILSAEVPIELIMLVNPLGAELRQQTEIRARALHAWALKFETEPLPPDVPRLNFSAIPRFPF